MEGMRQNPLTVLKVQSVTPRRLSSTSSSLSNLSYPQIPSRRSSLSMSAGYDSSDFATSKRTPSMSTGYDSSDLATSTRTPSLSDSLYNIDVVKIRREHAKTALDGSEDPFINNKPQRRPIPPGGLMTRSGYQLAPQLLVRWSSGSYTSLEPCLSSETKLTSSAMEQLEGTTSQVEGGHSNSDLMCPIELPVAFVTMRSYAGNLCMSPDSSMSVWTSVNITADVQPIPLPEGSTLAPIDVVILLNNAQRPSLSILTPMILASSILASNLVINHDRLAIGCVDGGLKKGFELLLPLGFHSFESIRTALNTFSLRELKKKRRRGPDLGNSIQQISQLLCLSPRAAFSHIVLVSANCPTANLFISGIDSAIGFHTISPQPTFPLVTANHPLGWHIFYDANADDPRESQFMRKVSKVVRQLRTGISPGFISNLELSITNGPGCKFESAIERCQLDRLRPGETWILKTKIGIPAKFYQETQLTGHPIIQDLINQVNEVIRMYSSEPAAQHVLTGRLKYRHSLLPTPHAISLETHCTIPRTPMTSFRPASSGKGTALMSYEQDDDTLSISFGSASESS